MRRKTMPQQSFFGQECTSWAMPFDAILPKLLQLMIIETNFTFIEPQLREILVIIIERNVITEVVAKDMRID